MAGYTNSKHEGQDYNGMDRNTSLVIGYGDHTVLNAFAADDDAPTTFLDCRAISADTGGTVKIDYKNPVGGATKTEVLMLVTGILRPVRNVLKLYRYTAGTTIGTAKSYSDAGVEITNAIKLHR